MKELIEKIKELQDVLNHSHCCQVTCSQIIEIIEHQESKPFNPVELGFKEFDEDREKYIKYRDDSKKEYYILNFCKKTENSPAFFYINIVSEYGKRKTCPLLPITNVPNHRFGVELLKNLGIIE